ncbi:MAG TPA: hypothetical protein VLT62_05300, partial [Candidatus Methylomirabilis sp.]|nr:hypothetical protein [Candidatus Methylomirabilis sp.]
MMPRQPVRSRALLVALLTIALFHMNPPSILAADSSKDGPPQLRHATFELRDEVKIKVPEGAKRLRVWMAVPQDDPAQQVSQMRIEAPYPTRVEHDSEGSKVLYLEASDPKEKEVSIVETFVLTRSEVRHSVDPSQA